MSDTRKEPLFHISRRAEMAWYKALGALRKQHPALRRGTIRYLAGDGHLLVFAREDENERILCAINAGDQPLRLDLGPQDKVTSLLGPAWDEAGPEGVDLVLPPRSGTALKVE